MTFLPRLFILDSRFNRRPVGELGTNHFTARMNYAYALELFWTDFQTTFISKSDNPPLNDTKSYKTIESVRTALHYLGK